MARDKAGRNKKWCEHYKITGRKEINKKKKQEKAERRQEKFARRREAGASYVYNKEKAAQKKENEHAEIKIRNGEPAAFNPYADLWINNYGSNKGKHTEFSRWKSIMGKLNYEIEKIKAIEKEEEMRKKKGGKKVG